jgi:hypothetical protein
VQKLESDLEETKSEAQKVEGLEQQLSELRDSSALELKSALETLTSELNEKYNTDMETAKVTYETELYTLTSRNQNEISDINAAHEREVNELKGTNLYQQLREMKMGFEADKLQADERAEREFTERVELAVAEYEREKKIMLESFEKEKEFLENEKIKAVEEAVANTTRTCKAEADELLEKDRKKGEGKLTTLAEAHSQKTAALETEIADAIAAREAAEVKAKKASELQFQLELRSKELEQVMAELESAKKRLEISEGKYN